MKFHQEKNVSIPVSTTGGRIGDQVLFSSHNSKNVNVENSFIQCRVKFDTLYTIAGIETHDTFFYANEEKNYFGGGNGCIGEYDIIIKAPIPEPEFQPVTLTLENIHEVKVIIFTSWRCKAFTGFS